MFSLYTWVLNGQSVKILPHGAQVLILPHMWTVQLGLLVTVLHWFLKWILYSLKHGLFLTFFLLIFRKIRQPGSFKKYLLRVFYVPGIVTSEWKPCPHVIYILVEKYTTDKIYNMSHWGDWHGKDNMGNWEEDWMLFRWWRCNFKYGSERVPNREGDILVKT